MKDSDDAKTERANRHMLGELRLIDLWDAGQLEGLMSLGASERMTAGISGDDIEFLGPDGSRESFPKETKVTLKNDVVEFSAETPQGGTRKFKLVLNRSHNPFSDIGGGG